MAFLSVADTSLAAAGFLRPGGGQAARARAAPPAVDPARTPRRLSCARRALRTSERISGSSGKDRTIESSFTRSLSPSQLRPAPWLDPDISRGTRERRRVQRAHVET